MMPKHNFQKVSALCATVSDLAGNLPRCFAAQRESALWQMAATDGGFLCKASTKITPNMFMLFSRKQKLQGRGGRLDVKQ